MQLTPRNSLVHLRLCEKLSGEQVGSIYIPEGEKEYSFGTSGDPPSEGFLFRRGCHLVEIGENGCSSKPIFWRFCRIVR
jgi:hypothetical protein